MLSKTVLRHLVDEITTDVHNAIDSYDDVEMYRQLGQQRGFLDAMNVISTDMTYKELIHRLTCLRHEYNAAYFDCPYDSTRKYYYATAGGYIGRLIKKVQEDVD